MADDLQHYRAYIMGDDGHILSAVELFGENDEAAKEQARQLVDGHDVELWQLERKKLGVVAQPQVVFERGSHAKILRPLPQWRQDHERRLKRGLSEPGSGFAVCPGIGRGERPLF